MPVDKPRTVYATPMSNASILFINTLCTACPPGEYTVSECTASNPTVCWPCEAGFVCVNGSKRQCSVGREWSGTGMAVCEPCSGVCSPGWMLVMQCSDGTSDRVCARCPVGFGCEDGTMQACGVGMYSDYGLCVSCGENRTTTRPGAVNEEACVCLFTDDNGQCAGECAQGQLAVGGVCRACPRGFGCDSRMGRLERCMPDTYSSPSGKCIRCWPNSHSEAGAGSEDECQCDAGFARDESGECSPCQPGTMYSSNSQCIPCPSGQYCLGKLHHEPCPGDMFSHQGSAVCSACRMNSGCMAGCTDQENCTCDDGFVDHGGECRRCPAGTMKAGPRRRVEGESDGLVLQGCTPCPRGTECLGGAEVYPCQLATFSGGNRSRCAFCTTCKEITVARCNATHDSVCELTPYALAIITLTQYYHTEISGDAFAMFALVLASSLPKAQLIRVCSGVDGCVECFQGQCPMVKMKRLAQNKGHMYELAVEIRSNAVRLAVNVESLTQSAFLPELAKTTMSKLTDIPFTLRSSVEHSVVCPDSATWNGGECVAASVSSDSTRTWLGLGVSAAMLVLIAVCRGRQKWNEESKITWARVEEVTESD
jgi:hypothetical protein